jgi:hypothetical protein
MRPIALPFALAFVLAVAACSDNGTDEPAATAEAQPEVEAVAPEPVEAPEPEIVEEEVEEPAPTYVGTWAFDPVWCTDQTNGFPITITEAQFQGRENTCDFNDISQTPEGGWATEMTCQSEGQTTTERLVMTPVGDRLALAYLDREGEEATLFSRCE